MGHTPVGICPGRLMSEGQIAKMSTLYGLDIAYTWGKRKHFSDTAASAVADTGAQRSGRSLPFV